MYEINRENFEKIVKNYEDYVDLYLLINGGSTEGITPFSTFYWRFTYGVRYAEGVR